MSGACEVVEKKKSFVFYTSISHIIHKYPHLAMGLSMGLDKPTPGQAFLVGPSKPRPVDHWWCDCCDQICPDI